MGYIEELDETKNPDEMTDRQIKKWLAPSIMRAKHDGREKRKRARMMCAAAIEEAREERDEVIERTKRHVESVRAKKKAVVNGTVDRRECGCIAISHADGSMQFARICSKHWEDGSYREEMF